MKPDEPADPTEVLPYVAQIEPMEVALTRVLLERLFSEILSKESL